jgi:predicted N-formylglutamate amidohydrolase
MNDLVQKGAVSPEDVVDVVNSMGAGRVVLVCEHAANVIPAELGTLGLNDEALHSHIAWDLGALAVAKAMSVRLDAPLIAQRVSRLVYDCNRSPDAQDAIPEQSEYQVVPGNAGLSAAERHARVARYYTPFCDALSACIEQRVVAKKLPALVTIHSFTPVFKGERRDLDVGILHDSDARLADEMLKCAEVDGALTVRRNAPYAPRDGVTFTLTRHALPRGLLNVMIEIRNDLIAQADSQKAMAERLSGYVNDALAALESDLNEGGMMQKKGGHDAK